MAEYGKKEPKNSSITVTTSSNNLEAYITVTAPENGGSDVTVDAVMSMLSLNKIVFGINNEVIKNIVSEKKYNEKICVAEAIEAINGKNGTVNYLFSQKNEKKPIVSDDGVADYKNLQYIQEIHQGDTIADITLPINGISGTDVRGIVIRAMNGKAASFLIGKGTEISQDKLKIIASEDGNLIFKNGAFIIEPVVTINGDVDASVGNLSFCGDIVVKGNVLDGFKLSSNKSITIMGSVSGAVLEAVGEIGIKRGCVTTSITCHGAVSALFFERCNIKCDNDISAQNYVMCDIYCAGSLKTIYTKSTGCGIVGGKCVTLQNIETWSIGSKSYAPTDITLGDNALLADERAQLLAKVQGWDKELSDLALIVNFLNEKKKELKRLPEDKEAILGNAARQKIIISKNISVANKRIDAINVSLKNKQHLTITCRGTIYPGTFVTVNDLSYKVDREFSHCMLAPSEDNTKIVVLNV